MQSDAKTVDEYFAGLPEDRKSPMKQLRKVIRENIPAGFSEQMSYGMVGYVVPHAIYPPGYHCDPKLPLPFTNLASQKNFIALYHMGLYSSKETLDWFVAEYPKYSSHKLDMGKSCIRFKKPEHIPYELIGQLMKKFTVKEWISTYEGMLKR